MTTKIDIPRLISRFREPDSGVADTGYYTDRWMALTHQVWHLQWERLILGRPTFNFRKRCMCLLEDVMLDYLLEMQRDEALTAKQKYDGEVILGAIVHAIHRVNGEFGGLDLFD